MSKGEVFPDTVSTQAANNPEGIYTVYAAGGLFTQHELTTNVLIKEAVWRISNGKYQLTLPQSRELRGSDFDAAHIRNLDLFELVKSDIVIARFDGLELDAGTVIEFAIAKSIGKPTLILRSDIRRLMKGIELPSGKNLDEPYDLMVKSWPRTVEVHIDALTGYVETFAKERETLGDDISFQKMLKAEMNTVQKGVNQIALELVNGLEEVIKMKSPYPPEFQETGYQVLRYSPGHAFEQLLTESKLEETISRLQKNGTL